jgi:methylated-DNA-[protein]-cysteine S-methyltransferase
VSETAEGKSEISNLKSPTGATPFATKVYTALRKVPAGQVITYAALGRRIHCRSPRAIGQALRANPFAPDVPCHRVIASDLSPGGFQGKVNGPALAKKLRLLAAEGVTFTNGRLSDPARLIR